MLNPPAKPCHMWQEKKVQPFNRSRPPPLSTTCNIKEYECNSAIRFHIFRASLPRGPPSHTVAEMKIISTFFFCFICTPSADGKHTDCTQGFHVCIIPLSISFFFTRLPSSHWSSITAICTLGKALEWVDFNCSHAVWKAFLSTWRDGW